MSENGTKFSCYLMGEGSLLTQCGDLLVSRGHTVLGIVSAQAAIQKWAAGKNLPCVASIKSVEEAFPTSFDYLFSIINYTMVPQAVLDLPGMMAINFHDGPLPRYAGLFATSWAILNGELDHGVAWHTMLADPDKGAVLAQKLVTIDTRETAFSLNVKCFAAALDTFAALVENLEKGDHDAEQQDLSKRTYFAKHRRPSLLADWTGSASDLDRLVRATNFGNQPNSFGVTKILCKNGVLLLRSLEILDEPSIAEPGTILSLWPALRIATSDHDVCVHVCKADGTLISENEMRERFGLVEGERLPTVDAELAEQVRTRTSELSAHEGFWTTRLASLSPAIWPLLSNDSGPDSFLHGHLDVRLDSTAMAAVGQDLRISSEEMRVSILLAFLYRIGGEDMIDVGLACDAGKPALPTASQVPLRSPMGSDGISFAAYAKAVAIELRTVREKETFLTDVAVRYPAMSTNLSLPIEICLDKLSHRCERDAVSILVSISSNTSTLRFGFAPSDLSIAHMQRLLRSLSIFAASCLADPSKPVLQISITDESERQAILRDGNDTDRGYPAAHCFHDLFARQAYATPNVTAIRQNDLRLSYRDLQIRAGEISAMLRATGVKRGDFVAVFLNRSVDLVAALIGVMQLGAAYLPLDKAYPAERIAYMIEDASIQVILTEAALVDCLPQSSAKLLVLDREYANPDIPPWVAEGPVDPDSAAYLIYTSGSTGRPKGVLLHHRGLTNLLWSQVSYPGFSKGDSIFCLATVSFDIFAAEAFAPLICGATVEMLSAEEASDGFAIRDKLVALRPTHLQATPATWRMLIAAGWREKSNLKMISTGEALPRELAEQLLERSPYLWNCYGPTETTVFSSIARIFSAERITIGRPVANTQMYILDARGAPIPPGLTGELYIGGIGLAVGYFNQPERTAECFVENHVEPERSARLYRTGDLARRLADGTIEYLGRTDGQVKIRGFRIEIGEVEYALSRHPAIGQAVVGVDMDSARGNALIAYVMPLDQIVPPSTADLRDFLSGILPGYMIPARIVAVDKFPLTPSGKVDRRALSVPLSKPIEPHVPADSTEASIFSLWVSHLRHSDFTANDNFFEVGGDSVLLISLLADLGRCFGRTLTALDMLRYPTVKSLARHLEGDTIEVAPSPNIRTRTDLRLSRLADLRQKSSQARTPHGDA